MKTERKLISNVFYLFLAWTISAIFSFLFWWVVAKSTLPNEYGLISTIFNTTALLAGISILGLATTNTKLIPEYLEKKQIKKVSALITFTLKTVLITNIIFSLSIISFLFYFSEISFPVIFLIILLMFFISFANISNFILRGFQFMKKITITEIIGNVLKFSITLILILYGFKFYGPLIGLLIGIFVATLLRFKSIPFHLVSTKQLKKKYILLKYGLPGLIMTLSTILFLNGQYTILTFLKGTYETGIFTVAMILFTQIVTISKITSQGLFPLISQLNVYRNKKSKQQYLTNTTFRYTFLVCFPLMCFLILFAKPIILIFSSEEYLSASKLFPIIGIASLLYGCSQIFLTNLFAIGKTKIQRNILITSTLIFLLLTFPLTYFLSSIGISIAYAVSAFIIFSLSLFYNKKFLGVLIQKSSILKIFLAMLVVTSFLYPLIKIIENLILNFILVIISVTIFILILIPLKFYTKDDIRLLHFISSRIPIFKNQIKKIVNYFSLLVVKYS